MTNHASGQKLNMVSGGPANWRDIIPDKIRLARAARLSAVMYQIESKQSIAWGYSREQLIPTAILKNSKGVEAAVVVAPSSESIHVVFRGTDGSLVDIGVDLQLQAVPYSSSNDGRTFVDGNVHKGFKESLEDGEISRQLDIAVQDALAEYPNYRIEANGHSLGAAQASLYAVHLATTVLPSEEISVITIGQPRVGDQTFMEAVNAIPNLAIWRMVNRDDIIPRIPLNILLGYYHVGHLIWFTREKGILIYYHQYGKEGIYEGVDSAAWEIDFSSNPLVAIFNHMPWEYELLVDEIAVPTDFMTSDGLADTCCFWVGTCLRYCKD